MPLGTVALAITGAAFFNAEDAFLNIALPVEGPTMDSCFGHSQRTLTYQYHANINSNTGSASGPNYPCLRILQKLFWISVHILLFPVGWSNTHRRSYSRGTDTVGSSISDYEYIDSIFFYWKL